MKSSLSLSHFLVFDFNKYLHFNACMCIHSLTHYRVHFKFNFFMYVYALRVRLSWQHNNNVFFRFKPALFCITFYKHWGIELELNAPSSTLFCNISKGHFFEKIKTCSSQLLWKFSMEFFHYFNNPYTVYHVALFV